MFDRIIYKLLDTIVDWCERYKEYKIHKSLGSDPVNTVVPEWTVKNIDYINFDELNKKFGCVLGLTDSQ